MRLLFNTTLNKYKLSIKFINFKLIKSQKCRILVTGKWTTTWL